jgi:hypothetical protein
MLKPVPRAPFKLVKARTGRYTLSTVEQALELRDEDPVAWRKLPAQLRREAKKAHEYMLQGPSRIRQISQAMEAALAKLHPKVRALADRDEAVNNLSLPELEIPPALAEHLAVPGKPGPHGPWKDEPKKTYFEIGRAVEEVVLNFQRLIDFRRSLSRATRENRSRLERELAKAGFSQVQVEAGVSTKNPKAGARAFIAVKRNLSFSAVKRYHLAYLADLRDGPAR